VEGYQQLFALTKNPKYVKMRPPGKTGRPSKLNNTANAGRIVRSRNGRKILPAFLLTICRGTCHRRDTAGKERASRSIRRRSGKRSFVKAVGTIRQENRQGRGKLPPCMPQSECGTGHTGYRAFLIRRRADHRIPAEPSAAEFSGLVSATALSEQGILPHVAAY
jgi:hypothetical protein